MITTPTVYVREVRLRMSADPLPHLGQKCDATLQIVSEVHVVFTESQRKAYQSVHPAE